MISLYIVCIVAYNILKIYDSVGMISGVKITIFVLILDVDIK